MTLEVGGDAPMTLGCRLLVNAAGHDAPALAAAIDAMPADHIPTAYFAKGNYFSCAVRAPFSRLIYPVPVPGGLGVHLTLDMAGLARFGPDVEWIDRIDYAVDPTRVASSSIRPSAGTGPACRTDRCCRPIPAFVRRSCRLPIAAQDFVIQGPRDHGIAGLINLFGIESPGLTSSLAIADHVAELAAAT